MTSLELTIRFAKSSEAVEIASISRVIIEHGLPWAWRPERVARSIRDRSVHVIVAKAADDTAGFAIMRYGDDVARLELFGVSVRYRGMGVGRRLLEWLEKCVAVAGIARVLLEVREGNEGAQAFYRRMGYRLLVRLPEYYQNGEAAVRMVRELRPAQAEAAALSDAPLLWNGSARPRR